MNRPRQFRKRRRRQFDFSVMSFTCWLLVMAVQTESFSVSPRNTLQTRSNSLLLQAKYSTFSQSLQLFNVQNSLIQKSCPKKRSWTILSSTNGRKNNNDNDDDIDIPADWSEDDILAEFEDDVVADEDDVEDVDEVVVVTDQAAVTSKTADDVDEEDDELDIDEIDLDEDDDEEIDEVLVEEQIGEFVESENWVSPNNFDPQLEQDDVIPWDPEEDGIDYELEDDPSDPNYMTQKALVEEAVEASIVHARDVNFDAYEFVQNFPFTPSDEEQIDRSAILKAVEERARGMILEEKDVEGMDFEKEYSQVSDLMDDDPYPRHETDEVNFLQARTGITDDDMDELDRTYKGIREMLSEEPWDKVMVRSMKGFEGLSNETLAEMDECLDVIGGSAYNVTNWLLYDLDFNVSNLILAAVKHNPDAPILFQHWYPQLATYQRYRFAQDRNFDFSWVDVENADITELERYYAGFGYDTIPTKAPSETGIISLEDLDEEEIKMAAFENWMTEVYNPEGDRKDFDDDLLRDEDNVFSDYYEAPQHPDHPTFDDAVDDLKQWKEELGEDGESDDPEITNYRNMMGQSFDFEVAQDEEFEREFRGHLVIACTGHDADLEIAEKITKRFEKEFGKMVYVETRVLALAREEDNVYEIWLESYEIDLLHSKKRATSNAKGWDGPAVVDDAQIDHLTERVRFLISDDARYSYRLELEYAD